MWSWWGTRRSRELPGRSRPPVEDRRMPKPWLVSSTERCCREIFTMLSVGQTTRRGEVASFRAISAPIPGDRPQRSFGEAPIHACPPVENPICKTFKEYEEVPKRIPLEFTEDGITCVMSSLSSTGGTLGEEAIELSNWLICFGCTLE